MTIDPDRRGSRFRFTKEICIGDIIQVIMIGGGIIWFAAHMDAQISAFGRELDEAQMKISEIQTDVESTKIDIAVFKAKYAPNGH